MFLYLAMIYYGTVGGLYVYIYHVKPTSPKVECKLVEQIEMMDPLPDFNPITLSPINT